MGHKRRRLQDQKDELSVQSAEPDSRGSSTYETGEEDLKKKRKARRVPKQCQTHSRRIADLQRQESELRADLCTLKKQNEALKETLKKSLTRENALKAQVIELNTALERSTSLSKRTIDCVQGTIRKVFANADSTLDPRLEPDDNAVPSTNQPQDDGRVELTTIPSPLPFSNIQPGRKTRTARTLLDASTHLAIAQLLEDKTLWKAMEVAFQAKTGRFVSKGRLQHLYYSYKAEKQKGLEQHSGLETTTGPHDCRQKCPLRWRLPPQLFGAIVWSCRNAGQSFEDVCHLLHEIGDITDGSSVVTRFDRVECYYGSGIKDVKGHEQWLLDLLRSPWLDWILATDFPWVEKFRWLEIAVETRRADLDNEINEQQLWLWSKDDEGAAGRLGGSAHEDCQ
ncbi:hypothetical protein LTR41_011739 [Exophiala xenobiotica]|nr:hypothetical protein LTR41_011739 [Exophiala xenobiotica]KAK5550465.1 hypothetical protein LTR46_011529 [Exophiala xenobiotica]